MTKIKQLVMGLIVTVGLVLVVAPASGAISAINNTCSDPLNANTVICKSQNDSVNTIIKAVVNTLLFLIGVAAVIVIIFGAITYTASGGEADAIKRAKNMILYAVVGLVIAFSAYAIVNWVLKVFGP